MKAKPPRQLPHPLNRVELWTVGREKVKAQDPGVLLSPLFVENGMMVLGIVGNHNRGTVASPYNLLQGAHELQEGTGVEALDFAAKREFTIPQTHSAKIPYAATRRIVWQHGIGHFRRNPHTTARSVLLELHFVESPKIHVAPLQKLPKFF